MGLDVADASGRLAAHATPSHADFQPPRVGRARTTGARRGVVLQRLVRATAITVPERSLKTSALRMRVGRLPHCSFPGVYHDRPNRFRLSLFGPPGARRDRGALQILRTQPAVLADARQHAWPNLLTIVKRENQVWPGGTRQDLVRAGCRLTAQPLRRSAASTRRARVLGHWLTPR